MRLRRQLPAMDNGFNPVEPADAFVCPPCHHPLWSISADWFIFSTSGHAGKFVKLDSKQIVTKLFQPILSLDPMQGLLNA
jgi:hypothetical protein